MQVTQKDVTQFFFFFFGFPTGVFLLSDNPPCKRLSCPSVTNGTVCSVFKHWCIQFIFSEFPLQIRTSVYPKALTNDCRISPTFGLFYFYICTDQSILVFAQNIF